MGRDGLFGGLSANQLLVRKRNRRIQTTNSFHWLIKYPNLIRGLVPTAINQLWVSDISYWKLKNNHVYINFVTDTYSHKIVGYHLAYTLEASASIRASCDGSLSPKQRAITHQSDRKIQYCSAACLKLLQDNKIKISLAESVDPMENAMAEMEIGIIKDEYLDGYDIETIKDAKELLKVYWT